MQQRSVALGIVFTVLTCGIYGIYWYICLTDDANQLCGRADTSGGMVFLFTLITCGFYSIYWAYRMGEKINDAKRQRGMPEDPTLKILYLVLSILGLSVITWALVQNEANQMLPS